MEEPWIWGSWVTSSSEATEPSGLGEFLPLPGPCCLLCRERFGVGDPQRLSWPRPSGPLPLGVFSASVSRVLEGPRRGAPGCPA